MSQEITGLVLAGGAGSRMASQDKGLVSFAGRPLAATAIERLGPQVNSLLISANRNIERYAAFGYPVVSDTLPGFAGPLAGIHAALAACATPWLATVPCDSPFFPTDLVARLYHAATAARAGLAVAAAAGRLQPVFLLCHRRVTADLAAFLAEGNRTLRAWLDRQGALTVPFEDASAFVNINTSEELRHLDQMASPLRPERNVGS